MGLDTFVVPIHAEENTDVGSTFVANIYSITNRAALTAPFNYALVAYVEELRTRIQNQILKNGLNGSS